MPVRYTVSHHGNGYAVFDNGVFHSQPGTGTWGAAKKLANRLNDSERSVKMQMGAMLAKDYKEFHHGPQWIVERKWDGMRAIFEVDPDNNETRIFSRTGQDLRPQFPELCRLHEILPNCILDGEIIHLVSEDQENLELLQNRVNDKNARQMNEIPVTVKFFDILELDGEDLRDQSLVDRRFQLIDTVGPHFVVEILNVDPNHPGEAQIPSHWEGVVSKLATSRYESGKRRSSWRKYKFVNRATLWATGLTAGKGGRANTFGAVLVQDANGIPRGQVGSGFTKDDIAKIMDLVGNERPILIEVEYRFLSKTGLMVNTAFKGFRTDKMEADAL